MLQDNLWLQGRSTMVQERSIYYHYSNQLLPSQLWPSKWQWGLVQPTQATFWHGSTGLGKNWYLPRRNRSRPVPKVWIFTSIFYHIYLIILLFLVVLSTFFLWWLIKILTLCLMQSSLQETWWGQIHNQWKGLFWTCLDNQCWWPWISNISSNQRLKN